MFIVLYQTTSFGSYNIHPSPSVPNSNQALVENCTTRCTTKSAYIGREHCKYQFVCFQTLRRGKACFLMAVTGAPLRTQRAESKM